MTYRLSGYDTILVDDPFGNRIELMQVQGFFVIMLFVAGVPLGSSPD